MSDGQMIQLSSGSGKIKVRYKVHVARKDRRARLLEGARPPAAPQAEPVPRGTIPRITRLLALAHHVQKLLDTGQVKDLAEVARRGHVTRARVTQIMNLLHLAPDIQEEILSFPPTTKGKDPITLRSLRQILAEPSFVKQRQMWGRVRQEAGLP